MERFGFWKFDLCDFFARQGSLRVRVNRGLLRKSACDLRYGRGFGGVRELSVRGGEGSGVSWRVGFGEDGESVRRFQAKGHSAGTVAGVAAQAPAGVS